tara:strand:- start:159 stop:347 length:189 start_codon:yes stop_codon:yes gene_type:complete
MSLKTIGFYRGEVILLIIGVSGSSSSIVRAADLFLFFAADKDPDSKFTLLKVSIFPALDKGV